MFFGSLLLNRLPRLTFISLLLGLIMSNSLVFAIKESENSPDLNPAHMREGSSLTFDNQYENLTLPQSEEILEDVPLSVWGFSPLMHAIYEQNEEQALNLLATDQIQKRDYSGNTALMVACTFGSPILVSQILSNVHSKINAQNYAGMTALMVAIFRGDIEIVKLVLANIPDLDLKTSDGMTALDIAKEIDCSEIISLLEAEAKLFPFVRVAHWGALEMIKGFVSAGADINAADEDGLTPLIAAIKSGRNEAVEYILSVPGIDINKADSIGETALMYATMNNLVALKMLLQKKDIDLNYCTSPDRWTSLMCAAFDGNMDALMLLLAHPKIQTELVCRTGYTALMIAEMQGNYDIADILCNKENKKSVN